MRIILANKFYYRRGGDCIYMLNLEQLLKEHGHEVAVFAMDYPENIDTPWKKYFPSNMTGLKPLIRPFGDSETKRKFTQLLDDFKPDVVHLNNIHTQLSPIIAEIAHKRGIRVVWTIHDLKLVCPRYDCLQNGKKLCQECFTNKKAVLRHRCMKNSLAASIIAYREIEKWNRERLEKNTDVFICPSQFMADKMVEGGYHKEKIQVLCNFIDVNKCKHDSDERGDYYCYVGRITDAKGVLTLIKAASQLPYKLKVIGDGPLEDSLKDSARDNIEFLGYQEWETIKKIEGNAKFTVLGSEIYENNPLSVIEAECLGTPVLGSRIGGIPELIEEGKTGMTFKPGDVEDLKDKIQRMWNASFDYKQIAISSQQRYNSEGYEENLLRLYRTGGGNLIGSYYCFIGRLSHEKGVQTLIEAANQLPYKLIVIGGGPLMDELKSVAHDNMEFVGFKQWDEIKQLVGGARFSVIPSEWYENNPLSVIEAECLGTPVLGARIGGIPELIDEGKTGMAFTSEDVNNLKDKIQQMWSASFDYLQIAEESMQRYNSEEYYNNIIKIYQK